MLGGGIAAAGDGTYTVDGQCTRNSELWAMAPVMLPHEYNAMRVDCIPHRDIHPHANVLGPTQAIHSLNTINTTRWTSTAYRTAIETRALVREASLEPYTHTTPSI